MTTETQIRCVYHPEDEDCSWRALHGFNYIDTPEELREFAARHGLREDWHEPDEQGIGARVVGTILDNAFGAHGQDVWEMTPKESTMIQFDPESRYSDLSENHELRVVVTVVDGEYTEEKAVINLASLLGWAARPTMPRSL